MAAVLCENCGRLCDNFCKILSSVATPKKLCSNPFYFNAIVAVVYNVPSIVCGLSTMRYGLGCAASQWQLGNLIFSFIHIIAAFHITVKFYQIRSNPSGWNGRRTSRLQTACGIMCYDPFVAIYIFVIVGAFIWFQIGISWLESGKMKCLGHNALSLVKTSISLDSGFFFMAFLSLCCSFWCLYCCCCCCDDDEQREQNNFYSNNTQQQYGSEGYTTRPSASSAADDVEYSAASPVMARPINYESIAATAMVIDDEIDTAPSVPKK